MLSYVKPKYFIELLCNFTIFYFLETSSFQIVNYLKKVLPANNFKNHGKFAHTTYAF